MQDILDDINLSDSISQILPSIGKKDFLSSFTHEETLLFVETLRDTTVDQTTNLPSDYKPITLANKVELKIGEKTYKLSINGYSMTEKIYVSHIAEDIVNNEHKLIFYNAVKVTGDDKIGYAKKTDLTDLKNIRKAFDIIVHTEDGYGTAAELKNI